MVCLDFMIVPVALITLSGWLTAPRNQVSMGEEAIDVAVGDQLF